MSKEFASFMASISGESAEERIAELYEILDKVMKIIMNSVDQLTDRLGALEEGIFSMTDRVVKLESMPIVAAPAPGAGSMAPSQAPAAPPPKPPPKPMSPMSARSALQSELKQLFARRKQT